MHPIELSLEPDSELAETDSVPFDVEEIRSCKIAAKVAQARYGRFQGQDALLMVIQIDFLPYYDVRFKYVEAQLNLVRSSAQPAVQQTTVVAYEPKQWEGRRGARNIQKGAHIGLDTGIATQAMTGFNAGANAGYDRTVEYAELPRAWMASHLAPTSVTWRLCENDVTHEGIPKPFKAVLIIAASEHAAIRMKYQVKLSK